MFCIVFVASHCACQNQNGAAHSLPRKHQNKKKGFQSNTTYTLFQLYIKWIKKKKIKSYKLREVLWREFLEFRHTFLQAYFNNWHWISRNKSLSKCFIFSPLCLSFSSLTDESGQTFIPLQFSSWETNYSSQYCAMVLYNVDQIDQSNVPQHLFVSPHVWLPTMTFAVKGHHEIHSSSHSVTSLFRFVLTLS